MIRGAYQDENNHFLTIAVQLRTSQVKLKGVFTHDLKAKPLNWDDFRFFLALARHHTVSAAGRELKVKHTTVARRISAFEARIGSRLFDHLKAGYVLTQAGENLYAHALVMEEQAQSVDRQMFGMDAQLKGIIKLTSSYDVLSHLVIPQLANFKHAYPEIDLQLHASSLLADLSLREADIALRLTPKPPEHLIGKEILPLRHGVYATRHYFEQVKKSSGIDHTIDHTTIVWRSEPKPEWISQHFPKSTIALAVDDITVMVAAVENHLGMARLPCFIADRLPNLLRLDLALTPSTWGIWVLSHADLRSTARVRITKEFLYEIIEQQRTLVEGLESVYFEGSQPKLA
ncbi:MAG: LysR family transcriptional regulator [Gammaproteobacteria bacterium]|nr:MAG: LysR family transcriptional regulator [Gammaproteobacteria bacterium]